MYVTLQKQVLVAHKRPRYLIFVYGILAIAILIEGVRIIRDSNQVCIIPRNSKDSNILKVTRNEKDFYLVNQVWNVDKQGWDFIKPYTIEKNNLLSLVNEVECPK